jgi:hypothetical protein
MVNLTLILILALVAQAARGRRGFVWSAVRIFVWMNYLLTVLLIIPIMAFNLAGGSLWPPRFPPVSIAFGLLVAGLGLATVVYLRFEYRRVTRLQADAAARRSAAYSS